MDTVSIPPGEIDKELPDKILNESEGILAWLVEGSRRWYVSGLNKPDEIEDAETEWRAEMDQTGRFTEDCCVTGDAFCVRSSHLYSAYKKWAEEGGEKEAISLAAFGRKLTAQGYGSEHTDRARGIE